MSEQTKEERARFQAWVQDRGCDTDGAWSAWQAAKSEVASALSLARSALQEREQRIRVLEEALEWTINKIDQDTCTHEETYRGGTIWTICRACGANWADDRGGFQPYQEPKELTAARSVLNKENGNG